MTSEYDDLLESVLEERDVPGSGASDGGALPPPASRSSSARSESTRAESGEVPSTKPSDGPATSPDTTLARRGMARQRERAGRCPMYAPSGTVCKTCGKVHPL